MKDLVKGGKIMKIKVFKVDWGGVLDWHGPGWYSYDYKSGICRPISPNKARVLRKLKDPVRLVTRSMVK